MGAERSCSQPSSWPCQQKVSAVPRPQLQGAAPDHSGAGLLLLLALLCPLVRLQEDMDVADKYLLPEDGRATLTP